MKITEFKQALEYFLDAVASNPKRDYEGALEAAMAGKARRYPVLSLRCQRFSDDPVIGSDVPHIQMPDTLEGKIACRLMRSLEPLAMLNPISSCIDLGWRSPQELITCFDIPLNPRTQYSPAFHKTVDEVLSSPMPDPRSTGSMPWFRQQIEFIKSNTPDTVKITCIDTQGPFNIAHSLVGEEILLCPYTAPSKYHEFMTELTEFWIESVCVLKEWIGGKRQSVCDKYVRIAECSANLISPQMYEEFVLPYDMRIADKLGPLHIHPCSGPHVFRQTLRLLPQVMMTEAGYIAQKSTAAGAIGVDEALVEIGEKPIVLKIGQELPQGKEIEFIKRDLDRYAVNRRLMFEYTGMYWTYKDKDQIFELHTQLDEYWMERYG